jgi:sugar phosphate isomerase/epimerase
VMIHPRLSVNALSSFKWSFEQDLALWRSLGVHHAGLLISKIDGDRRAKGQQLKAAGIVPTTVVCGGFALGAPETWEETRSILNGALDFVADLGGESVYFAPGRTTGAPWNEVADLFVEAVAPCVEYAKKCRIPLGIEPSLRTDASFVNTLRDAVDICGRTGLKVIADFGNCWMERDLREVLRRAGPHLCLVQIDDVVIGAPGRPSPGGRVNIGEGELPVRRLMQDVLDAGYTGLFDLEVLGPVVEAEGYESSLRRGVGLATGLLTETCG